MDGSGVGSKIIIIRVRCEFSNFAANTFDFNVIVLQSICMRLNSIHLNNLIKPLKSNARIVSYALAISFNCVDASLCVQCSFGNLYELRVPLLFLVH